MKNEAFTIYPAIDIKNGKCVRLLFGDLEKETIYGDDPLDKAIWFVDQGAEWIHIVDLDGAVKGKIENRVAIQKILKTLNNKVKIQIGGGIRDRETMDFWIQNSVERVILGTLATENYEFIQNLDKRYYKKIIIGADVRDGMIASHGWINQSKINAIDLMNKFNPSIINSVIYTDISKDGSLKGVSLNQTRRFAKSIPHTVIASGGVRSIEDIVKLSSEISNGIVGVIIGRALYEKKFTFAEALNAVRRN